MSGTSATTPFGRLTLAADVPQSSLGQLRRQGVPAGCDGWRVDPKDDVRLGPLRASPNHRIGGELPCDAS